MKSFRSLFYTRTAKVIMILLLLVAAYIIGECQIEYFRLYNKDRQSFNNAMIQLDSFDYESSYYFRNTVEETIQNIVTLSMDYGEIFESERSVNDLLTYYASIGDSTFPKIYENLVAIEGFSFAFVNHESKLVYSNISELNCKPTSTDVREYFGSSGKTLLIARSCQSPYFETNTFISYGEFIRSCAEKYGVNFDLYIYFGDESTLEKEAENCRKLHTEMRQEIEKLNDRVILFIVLTLLITAFMLTVTGRNEPGGKVYQTSINKLPNDLLLVLYGIVMGCIFSLYRTSIYMILSHKAEHDNFWFTRPDDFYTNRVHACIVLFICILVNILCILKRSYQSGNLIENTYVYPALKRYGEKLRTVIKNRKKEQ